jgi:tRNA-specific 2-thiouridylase
MTKRVLVAMSGGVDSSVAAALLKEQGYDVEGVTMKLTAGLCCDLGSAQAVCGRLGIDHRIIDAQEAFSSTIVREFVNDYCAGRTPNPCISCNDLIKFRLLLDHARSNGFSFLATGHYARIERDPATSRPVLRKGADKQKDQSYFLYRLTPDQMEQVLLPLGELRKSEVRELGRRFGLPSAERPESQEICFVPGDDYRAFLRQHAPEALRPGELVLTDGTAVGRHDGIAFFTVGQRRHLGVSTGERLYVVRIEPDTNRVVLGKQEELETAEALLSAVTLNGSAEDLVHTELTVKVRYRAPFVPAKAELLRDGRLRIVFGRPIRGVCPGQAAVLYRGDRVLGGGTIESSGS